MAQANNDDKEPAGLSPSQSALSKGNNGTVSRFEISGVFADHNYTVSGPNRKDMNATPHGPRAITVDTIFKEGALLENGIVNRQFEIKPPVSLEVKEGELTTASLKTIERIAGAGVGPINIGGAFFGKNIVNVTEVPPKMAEKPPQTVSNGNLQLALEQFGDKSIFEEIARISSVAQTSNNKTPQPDAPGKNTTITV